MMNEAWQFPQPLPHYMERPSETHRLELLEQLKCQLNELRRLCPTQSLTEAERLRNMHTDTTRLILYYEELFVPSDIMRVYWQALKLLPPLTKLT